MKNQVIRPFLLLIASIGLAAPMGSCAFADERSGEGPGDAQAAKKQLPENDRKISAHADRMVEEGRKLFRFDSFGSEAFWGDALQLHKAIAGEKNGGVGGGVSPKA